MTGDVAAPSDVPTEFSGYVAARGRVLQVFAHLMTGDRVEAADLVQDALERAWPRWDTLVAQGNCEAYLRRSIANGAVSRWRKLRRIVPVAEPVHPHAPAAAELGTDADAAWLLCAELPSTQRAAVVLRFYEDLSYAEIGAVLDCAEATARSHVHRALRSLRERLTTGDGHD